MPCPIYEIVTPAYLVCGIPKKMFSQVIDRLINALEIDGGLHVMVSRPLARNKLTQKKSGLRETKTGQNIVRALTNNILEVN